MWVSVALKTDAAHADALSDALLAAGAISVSVEDAQAGTDEETPQFGEPGGSNDEGWRYRLTLMKKPNQSSRPSKIKAQLKIIQESAAGHKIIQYSSKKRIGFKELNREVFN
jgi:ribosomal protein L11 methylase PrmA